mgnify:CR=1 FL=1
MNDVSDRERSRDDESVVIARLPATHSTVLYTSDCLLDPSPTKILREPPYRHYTTLGVSQTLSATLLLSKKK